METAAGDGPRRQGRGGERKAAARVHHHPLADRRATPASIMIQQRKPREGERRQPAVDDQPGRPDLRHASRCRSRTSARSARIRRRARSRSQATAARRGHDAGRRARLGFIDNSVDRPPARSSSRPSSRTPTALWPGQFVDVALHALEQATRSSIPPRRCRTGRRAYLFVVMADRTVEVRTVKVARTDGDARSIAAGSSAGERVVTDGQLRLAPGAQVKRRPSARRAGVMNISGCSSAGRS